MKRLGIFLAYFPEQSIRKDGLGRLLAFVLRGALARPDLRVTIACPRWYTEQLKELFYDHDIDPDRIELLTTRNVPYLFRVRHWVESRRRRTRRANPLREALRRTRREVRRQVLALATSYNFRTVFGPVAIIALISLLALVVLIVASPVLLTAAVLLLLWRLTPVRIKLPIKQGLSFSLSSFRDEALAQDALELLRQREMKNLVSRINAREEISAWFSPALFWPEIEGIRARKCVAAPDIVMLEFPTRFATPFAEKIFDRLSATALSANRLITYSEHVRDEHLVRSLGIDADRIKVIRHGRTSLAEYLDNGRQAPNSSMRERGVELLRSYSQVQLSGIPFWRNIDLGSTRYIFYSSQFRPHKNILMLLQLVARLNRVSKRDIRLVLTGNFAHDHYLGQYVREHELEAYVLSAHDLPSELLAAFNACATLSITPTLFEGGFPFTFCEAYSVGTPSILSDIPVIREVVRDLSPEMARRTLFDPYDLEDLIQKATWALDNRALLHDLQADLYRAFPSWEQVAASYVSAVLNEEASV